MRSQPGDPWIFNKRSMISLRLCPQRVQDAATRQGTGERSGESLSVVAAAQQLALGAVRMEEAQMIPSGSGVVGAQMIPSRSGVTVEGSGGRTGLGNRASCGVRTCGAHRWALGQTESPNSLFRQRGRPGGQTEGAEGGCRCVEGSGGRPGLGNRVSCGVRTRGAHRWALGQTESPTSLFRQMAATVSGVWERNRWSGLQDWGA